MLSHLRFHRRGPASTPTSPAPDQQPPSPFSNQGPTFPNSTSSSNDASTPVSSSSAMPPMLPPITRVTSNESEPQVDWRRETEALSPGEGRPQPQQTSKPPGKESGFIGGLALQNYRRGISAQSSPRPDTADASYTTIPDPRAPRPRPQQSLSSYPDVPARPSPNPNSQPTSAKSFASPTDLQQGNNAPTTGRRPAGARLASDSLAVTPTTSYVEPQKGKKGLPFLKNPMSTLLLRRKNSHNVPDLMPLKTEDGEPAYDPRIKGTRVHDFSAPRRKHQAPSSATRASQSPPRGDSRLHLTRETSASSGNTLPVQQASYVSSASQSASASVISQPVGPSTSSSSRTKPTSSDIPPVPTEPPPVPPKDTPDRTQTQASSRSRLTLHDGPSHQKSVLSTRSSRSRNVSLSERPHRDTISSIPKHMKSTSSRFSFDMIGAAGQEKLLEERHRQRELEKQTTEPTNPRDSSYDDFDEDAMYEAMMDDDYEEDDFMIGGDDGLDGDDGFEEEEPGISAEDDPDNDQENFEGFVFQRSNPTSNLASPDYPGALITPRDASGQVIGFAVSRDSPNLLVPSPLSPFPPLAPAEQTPQPEGLGIQGIQLSSAGDAVQSPAPGKAASPLAAPPQFQQRDELDFGDGVVPGFENEFAEDLAAGVDGDAVPFDESIFDNNDTDQFGRPLPGAFAQAQSQRQAARKGGTVKRESDMTSHFSTNSFKARSTARTSLSVDIPKNIPEEPTKISPSASSSTVGPDGGAGDVPTDPMAAYQAALVAAAHSAVASGKFERDTPPDEEDEPKTLGHNLGQEFNHDYDDDDNKFDPSAYEDDGDDFDMSFNNMDDYELDDDAIIAEANADMLAYDSDYYGQEFGFYSAPAIGSHSRGSSEDTSGYEFAGGVFGSKDIINRSKSGRIVSREPNLTPITERSEYSNRNSVMSLALPPIFSGTPIVQSPGLAQLAMMADRGDEQMSLSALMKLRSKAWGGSQISLSSSRDESPRSERGENMSSPVGGHSGSFSERASMGGSGGHARKSSAFSTMSRESDANSATGSPTLTGMDLPSFPTQPMGPPPPIPEGIELSSSLTSQPMMFPNSSPIQTFARSNSFNTHGPKSASTYTTDNMTETPVSATSGEWNWGKLPPNSASNRRPGPGHRHKGSSDSISYVQEEEGGSGETRWVMERRRTGESGQTELLEREVVEGGRI